MSPQSVWINTSSVPSTVPIGTGGRRAAIGGVIAGNGVLTGNAADTNFVFPMTTTIPAGTLLNDGDMLEIRWTLQLSAAVSTKTYQTNFGYTSTGVGGFTGGTNVQSSATATASVMIWSTIRIRRINNTNVRYETIAVFSNGSFQATNASATIGSLDLTNTTYNLGIGIQDGTGNANAIQHVESTVEFMPAAVP